MRLIRAEDGGNRWQIGVNAISDNSLIVVPQYLPAYIASFRGGKTDHAYDLQTLTSLDLTARLGK